MPALRGSSGKQRRSKRCSIVFRPWPSGSNWMEDGLMHADESPVRFGRAPLTARELQVVDLVERG